MAAEIFAFFPNINKYWILFEPCQFADRNLPDAIGCIEFGACSGASVRAGDRGGKVNSGRTDVCETFGQ